jgi:hypothetical protein
MKSPPESHILDRKQWNIGVLTSARPVCTFRRFDVRQDSFTMMKKGEIVFSDFRRDPSLVFKTRKCGDVNDIWLTVSTESGRSTSRIPYRYRPLIFRKWSSGGRVISVSV